MKLFHQAWNAWKRFGRLLGDWIARVVLTIFYFTLFMPFGIGVRMVGDPLAIKSEHRTQWLDRKTRDKVIDDALRLS